MKEHIDILIINNCPSFYKINLYNELSRHCSIHVIFIGLTDQVVINESVINDICFPFTLLSTGQIEKRNKIKCIANVYNLLKKFEYEKIIYGGYSDLEEKLFMFLTPKENNCLQFESSIFESSTVGIKKLIKRLIFHRISIALPSGKLQTEVFKQLNFGGKIIETKGVGIFNRPNFNKRKNKKKDDNNIKYLFVGRLIPKKNVAFLIDVFNETGKNLTIVGKGELEKELKKKAKSNIKFVGFVPNNEIHKIYQDHDIFILPSLEEPWGLVVEEAIYYGLPVLISDRIGCQVEMVIKPNTGVIFNPLDKKSLKKSISLIEENIEEYKKNCSNFDFEQRDKEQVKSYLKILEL